MTTSIRRTLLAAATILVVLLYLHAQLGFRRAATALPGTQFEEVRLENAGKLQVLFLNYSAFAADLGWVSLIVNYGEGLRAGRSLDFLAWNAEVVRELDPRFYSIYEWFSGAWSARKYPVTLADAKLAAEFARAGFEVFPSDSDLAFHAAMTFVGLDDANEADKFERWRQIIDLLEIAAARGDSDAPFILTHYRKRLARAGHATKMTLAEELDLFIRVFSATTDIALKRRLAEAIRARGGESRAAKQFMMDMKAFNKHHNAEPYVSPGLHLAIWPQ